MVARGTADCPRATIIRVELDGRRPALDRPDRGQHDPTSRRAGSCTAIWRDRASWSLARAPISRCSTAHHIPPSWLRRPPCSATPGSASATRNSLAGVVRAHVAAREVGIALSSWVHVSCWRRRHLSGLADRSGELRAADAAAVPRPHARAEGWLPDQPCRAARARGRLGHGERSPPPLPDARFAERCARDARDLRDCLALPLLLLGAGRSSTVPIASAWMRWPPWPAATARSCWRRRIRATTIPIAAVLPTC